MFSGGFGATFRKNSNSSNNQDDNLQFNDWNTSSFSNPLLGSNNVFGGQAKNPLSSNPLSSNPLSSNPLSINPLSSNPLSTSHDGMPNPFSSFLQSSSFGNVQPSSVSERLDTTLDSLNDRVLESSGSSSEDEELGMTDIRDSMYRDNMMNDTMNSIVPNGKSSTMGVASSSASANINQILLQDMDIDQYIDIKHVVARNGRIFIARMNGFDVYDEDGLLVRKCDVTTLPTPHSGKRPAKIQIPSGPIPIVEKIFVDPNGLYVLISCEDSQTFFFNMSWGRSIENAKLLQNINAHIESVGWIRDELDEVSSVSALIGTRDSKLYHVLLRDYSDPVYEFKQLFDLNGKTDVDNIGPIHSITIQRAPSQFDEDTFVILVCTGQILFYFVGAPDLKSIFDAYNMEQTLTYKEFPLVTKSRKELSQLITFSNYEESAESFAWLCHAGIVHGPIDYTDLEIGANPIPEIEIIKWDHKGVGISIAITAYHMFVLTEEKLFVYMLPAHFVSKPAEGLEVAEISFSSIRKVYEKTFDKKVDGVPKGLCYDESIGEIYLYTSTSVIRISMEEEEMDVWRLFLARASDSRTSKPQYFTIAERLAKGNPVHLDIVNTERANFLFNQGKYQEAAILYNRTTKPFEETCMKFANKNEWDALRCYLLEKLDILKEQQKARNDPNFLATQLTCITTWLTELYSSKIDNLITEEMKKSSENNGKSAEEVENHILEEEIKSADDIEGEKYEETKYEINGEVDDEDTDANEYNEDDEYYDEDDGEIRNDISFRSNSSRKSDKIEKLTPLESIRKEFHEFLEENKVHLSKNKMATFRIIESHTHMEDAMYFATLTNEFKRVISDHIISKNYAKALEILDTKCKNMDSKEFFPLIYMYAPVLMQHLPKETVNMLMKKRFLDPCMLIPSLMRYKAKWNSFVSPESENYIIHYLHWCIVINENKDASIHNLLLLMYAQEDEDEKLSALLDTEPHYYDEKYALRVCQKYGKMRACIQLLMSMKSYEDAVKLALDHNEIDLAKECAERSYPSESFYESTSVDPRQKALWLLIAQHIIESSKNQENNLQYAVSFLESTDALKLEDILPLFPDFKQIKNFRDIIVKSLEDHNSEIQALKEQMEETNDASALARIDMNQLKHRCNIISPTSRCSSYQCSQLLLSQDYYMFPCGHMYHTKCLINDIRKVCSQSIRQSIDSFIAQLRHKEKKIEAQIAIDKIISAECPLCSDYLIDTVDTRFISATDNDAKSWMLSFNTNDENSDSEDDLDETLTENSEGSIDMSEDSF